MAQNIEFDSSNTITKDTIYHIGDLDTVPQYIDGEEALMHIIYKEFKLPSETPEGQVGGTIYIQFIVTAKGDIQNIRIVRSPDAIYNKEAIRVISLLKGYKPGYIKGRAVNSYMLIPLHVDLR